MTDDEIFIAADNAYDNGDFTKALLLFTQLAERSDYAAMSRLASMYTCGEGVACDYQEAIRWEIKALGSGQTSSLINIGITYRMLGDIKVAKEYFEQAVLKGDGEAALQLAKLYMVSDKEIQTTKRYLNIALQSDNLCEESIDEAKSIMAEMV
ncbi:MAG: TPR repeat protein [Phenylobacterium sp.]|jgi:TPR repeat protein